MVMKRWVWGYKFGGELEVTPIHDNLEFIRVGEETYLIDLDTYDDYYQVGTFPTEIGLISSLERAIDA
jgi:hypothetical protein